MLIVLVAVCETYSHACFGFARAAIHSWPGAKGCCLDPIAFAVAPTDPSNKAVKTTTALRDIV